MNSDTPQAASRTAGFSSMGILTLALTALCAQADRCHAFSLHSLHSLASMMHLLRF